jgi:hypothetical protein
MPGAIGLRLEGNVSRPRGADIGRVQRVSGPCAHSAVRVFNILAASERWNRLGRRALFKRSRRKPKKRKSERPARPEARRRRYWPSPRPGRGVPGPARVGTQGGSCAGNIVHSVPGGTIRAAEGIFRKSCGSGSGSPQDRRSAYIETDRFSYLSHSQLGQRS